MSRIESTAQFFFTAIGADGGRKRGMRVAVSESALAEALRDDGLLLLRARRLPAWTSSAADLPLKDQAAFNQQLSAMVDRGVPLVEALEVAGSVVTSQTKEKIERIRSLVRAGSSFAEACRQVGGFDDVTVTVYRTAERTGNLGEAAGRLAAAAQRRLAIATKALTVMIYPAIVFIVSIAIATFVLVVVVPRIGEALEQSGAPLPWYTVAVVGLGNGLRAYGLYLLVGLVALVSAAVAARRYVAAALLTLLRGLPAVAKLSLAMESARFFAVMGAMTRSGVPIADALAVSSGAVSHPVLRKQLDDLKRKLVEGGLLRTLLEGVDALPLATRRLLIAAERAGDLDAAFDALSDDMAREVEKRSERLLAMLEPAMIVGMFLLVGTLLLSIMIPMISLTSGMQD